MNNTFEKTAVWSETYYNHFGIHPSIASMYGDKPEDIETLTLKISEDQSIPEPNSKCDDADYWGWYDSEKKRFSSMIYAQRFILDICFPAGIKGSEKAGKGKAYRLDIIKGGNI